jgi:hypothetical protein
MIHEIKGVGLLTGFRGVPPTDIPFLEDLLIQVSGIVEAHPEIKKLDLNPGIAHSVGAVVVDARIILEYGSEWCRHKNLAVCPHRNSTSRAFARVMICARRPWRKWTTPLVHSF